MITKQELVNRLQKDTLSAQFMKFIFDDLGPADIPAQHDENSIALLLLHAVSRGNQKVAAELMEPISKRNIGETSVWVNNDLFFVALAISSLKFSMYCDFVCRAADHRTASSAGGSHRGLAQAVKAAVTGNPDFTKSAAIFSLVLSRYMEKFTPNDRDFLNAYNSFQSYDWDADQHSNVRCALALRGFQDIIGALDLVTQIGHKAKLCAFAEKFPKKITIFSRIIACVLASLMIILFIINIQQSNKTGIEWVILNKFFVSGLGISSILAILTLVPKVEKKITNFMLWLFGYPTKIEKTKDYNL